MRKLSFELIRKIDYVLVLVLAVLGIICLAAAMLGFVIDRFRYRSDFNQMPVVEDAETEIKEHVEFEGKLKDVFVFSVRSSGLRGGDADGPVAEAAMSSGLSNSAGSYWDSKDGITNLLFVREDGSGEKRLFPQNLFIYKYSLGSPDEDDSPRYPYQHAFNVYAVIRADTDGDKLLTSRDDVSLYVSAYDGSGLSEVSPAALSFCFIDTDQFLYTEYDGEKLSYYVYDGSSGRKTLIKAVAQEPEEKRFEL